MRTFSKWNRRAVLGSLLVVMLLPAGHVLAAEPAGEWAYPRRCLARKVGVFDKVDARRRLYSGQSGRGDFRLLESGDWPANETYFDVAADARFLYVTVMALEGGAGGGSTPETADAVEVLFDPLHDHIGMIQYGADSLGGSYHTTHWPYRSLEMLGRADAPWKVEQTIDHPHEARDLVRFYFFRFDLAMFGGHRCVGLNVCRWQGAIREASSWNLVSSIGFPDAGCFGHLWLGEPASDERPPARPAVSARRPLRLFGTYDWPDHVWNVPYGPEDLQREMCWYKRHGLDGVYWLDYDSYALQAGTALARLAPVPERMANLREAIRRFGTADFLPQAVKAAKQAGLEFVTLYKPFDLLLGDEFLAAHPQFTMRRNPAWTHGPQWPVTTLRLFQHDDSPFPFRPDAIVLWSGRDRSSYSRVQGPLAVAEKVVERPQYLWSPAGKIAGTAKRTVRCLEIHGLEVSGPWLAVEFAAADASLRNRQYLLAEIVNRSGRELFWRLCVHQGTTSEALWWQKLKWPSHDAAWIRMDTGMDRLLTIRAPRVALEFSLDVPLRHETILDTCFAEVRQYWLSKIRRGIDAGADGVGVRIAHHVDCDDWLAYAFSEPAVEEFRRRRGRDPQPNNDDYTLIRSIRGDYFTRLLREARAITAAAGRKFCLHIENRMLVPPQMDCYCQIHWDWRTWIRERLADEIDLKYIGPNHPAAYEEIVPLARRHGIKVNWITADLDPRSRPRSIAEAPLLADRAAEAGFDNINLYELWSFRTMSKEGFPLARGCAKPILLELRKRIDEINARRNNR